MLNLSSPVTFQELRKLEPQEVLAKVKLYCAGGKPMHPDSLMAVVMQLTYTSRNLGLKQAERDEAAHLATHLANAALKTYGQNSDFCTEMVANINMIMRGSAAA